MLNPSNKRYALHFSGEIGHRMKIPATIFILWQENESEEAECWRVILARRSEPPAELAASREITRSKTFICTLPSATLAHNNDRVCSRLCRETNSEVFLATSGWLEKTSIHYRKPNFHGFADHALYSALGHPGPIRGRKSCHGFAADPMELSAGGVVAIREN